MTNNSPVPSKDAPVEFRASGGLRLRLWLACLGGAMVAAGGIWWVIGTQFTPGPETDLALVVSWLGAVAGLGVIVGAAFALWLDHGVVAQARGLAQAVATRQIARLRGLPASSGWGELSLLTQQIQQMVTQYRHAERAAQELGLVRDQLNVLREALDRWNESERWTVFKTEAGHALPVAESLHRGLRRLDDVRDQNLEAARQIGAELERAVQAARESSEQAERGFVEATALLTTVRELQRLQGELAKSLGGDSEADPGARAPSSGAAATMAREAIEELVSGSAQTVEHLARGLGRVQAIADRVSVLANRATLVALNNAVAGQVLPQVEQVEQSRQLVIEIRDAVDQTERLARELEAEVQGATERMRLVRERVAQKLERLPAAPQAPRAQEEAAHLLERVREMVQDATRKGERLSAAGERASRAAESLLRTLESERHEMEGLLVRMAPVEPAPGSPRPLPGRRAPAPGSGLRLLSQEDLLSDPGDFRRAPGAGEEPR